MKTLHLMGLMVAAGLLAGCESDQKLETGRKLDTKIWHNNHTAFLAPNYQAGEETRWREQINDRAKGQNEYTRAPASR